MRTRKLLSIAVLIVGSIGSFAQAKPGLEDASSTRLRVRVSSDKSVYKLGEPILLTITLRNEGDSIVWVSKPYGIGRYPGEFFIEIVAPDGSVLPNKSPVMALRSGGPAQSTTDRVSDFMCERVPFSPGDFWGVTRSIEDAYVSIKTPGRYQLTARFNESPIENLSKDELQALVRDVKLPIQARSLVSEPIYLEIR